MTDQKETQFFNRQRLIRIGSFFIGGIGAIAILGWIGSHYQGIKIDWSFLLPLGGLIGGAIPVVTGAISWIEKRNDELKEFIEKTMEEFKKRLDTLEATDRAQEEEIRRSGSDRAELRKILLKLEARIESFRDTQVGSQLGELTGMIRSLVEKRDE